ncbi:hypothetical protein GCM10022271_12870 [Corallibacter vietnamensis]|uniref:Uncharacterized protein n=1 Tax=Corallibacter vietnamensis TaxID=904130 RepID=A0ABP7H273_9FLAO
MRKNNSLLIVVVLVLTLFSCSKDDADFVVGQESLKIEDISNVNIVDVVSDVEIVVTTAYIKEKWESNFNDKFSLKKVAFNSFKIIETDENQTGKKVYFLKAISDDRTIETGVFLKKTDDTHYSLQ